MNNFDASDVADAVALRLAQLGLNVDLDKEGDDDVMAALDQVVFVRKDQAKVAPNSPWDLPGSISFTVKDDEIKISGRGRFGSVEFAKDPGAAVGRNGTWDMRGFHVFAYGNDKEPPKNVTVTPVSARTGAEIERSGFYGVPVYLMDALAVQWLKARGWNTDALEPVRTEAAE